MSLARAVAVLCCGLALTGCERLMRDMYEQPRYDPGEASPLFPDGKASRAPPPGTVPRAMGDLAATSSGRRGEDEVLAQAAAEQATRMPAVTHELLHRGQERYNIYCMPCHGPVGEGDGPVVRRGFPPPPSYHQDRLRAASEQHFFEVITQGHGIMPSYADRVAPTDRWAIVAYIRALQLSQYAPVAELPPALQTALHAAPPSAASSPVRAASAPEQR